MSTAQKFGIVSRLVSLDAFRGVTVASMILVNNPGSWEHTYSQLLHSPWHGWTFTDFVFPSFLWIVGVSITFSVGKRKDQGVASSAILWRVFRRSLLLCFVAYAINGFPAFHYSYFRIPGVLQRIAICSFVASAIFLFANTRTIAYLLLTLLTTYWVIMTLVPVPGFGAGVLTPEGNFARYLDSWFLTGHMWSQTRTWDPEGLFSTVPALATTLFGVLIGKFLHTEKLPEEKTGWLFVSGCGLLFAGLVMNIWLPINKNLWTSSFSVFMAGLSTVVFACFYWLVDVQRYHAWAKPFVILGMNAIAAYVFSSAIEQLVEYFRIGRTIYQSAFAPLASPKNASLLYALANVIVVYAFSYALFRRRWFLRL